MAPKKAPPSAADFAIAPWPHLAGIVAARPALGGAAASTVVAAIDLLAAIIAAPASARAPLFAALAAALAPAAQAKPSNKTAADVALESASHEEAADDMAAMNALVAGLLEVGAAASKLARRGCVQALQALARRFPAATRDSAAAHVHARLSAPAQFAAELVAHVLDSHAALVRHLLADPAVVSSAISVLARGRPADADAEIAFARVRGLCDFFCC
jgi:hypothetical protein